MCARDVRAIIYKLIGVRIQNYKTDVLVKEANSIYNSLCAENNIPWDNNRANAFQHAYISAKYTYEYGANKALLIGNFVEIATWDDLHVDDINKDLYNNRTGVQYATMGIDNNLLLEDIAVLLFNGIQAGTQDFIIDASINNDKFYMQDLTYLNLILETIEFGIASNLNPNDTLQAVVKSSSESYVLGIHRSFTEAEGTRFTPAQDPLLLDLDGDGIETTSVEEGVYFDHGNDGFEELSAWVGSDDGILVHDKNNNGVIDNGNEMFGDNYTKLDGTVATQGFDALSDFDTNSDGVINAQDTDFDSVKVLKGDGTLLSLTDAGISSISLTKTNTNVTDSNGNVRYYNGTFVRTDNTTGAMGDYDMAYDSITTIAKEWLEVPEAIAELPDIAGMGNVYSLHQAMVRDSELKTMVEAFVNASDTRTRQGIVEGLIYRWTGVENVESDSRGGLIDAKKLEALEKVVGRGFVGMNISNVQNSTNPIGNAAQVLQNTFTMLMEYVYAELASQTILKPLFEELDFVYNEDLGKYEYDLTSVRGVIDTAIEENPTAGKALLLDFAKSFVNLGLVDVSNYADFKSYYTVQGEDYELLFGSVESINMYGTSEGDVLDGTSEQETIFGYEGNDTINARMGDDLVYGGDGDDTIDTCFGNDVIYGESGDDNITAGNGDDLIYGGVGHDTINSGAGADIVYGGEGDDIIYNGGGNDYIDAGAGNDTITSTSTGAETFICGLGNDTFDDSKGGDDVFIFNLGDGNDVISNNNGTDVIRFGEGITLANTQFSGNDTGILITFANSTDSIMINTCLISDTRKVENFEFSDGTVLTITDVLSMLESKGTEGVDTLTGTVAGETMYGYGGNDTINSGDGDDVIYGGAGDDNINSGKGADIVYGGEGDDIIYNGGGNDYIDAGAGNDTITSSGTGSETFICGLGNDTFNDSKGGDDVFIFNLGDGNDVISNNNGTDVIRFGEGITLANTQFRNENYNLVIDFANSEDSLTVNTCFASGTRVVENFEFSDGTILTFNEISSGYLSTNEINGLIQDISSYGVDEGMVASSITEVSENAELMTLVSNSMAA